MLHANKHMLIRGVLPQGSKLYSRPTLLRHLMYHFWLNSWFTLQRTRACAHDRPMSGHKKGEAREPQTGAVLTRISRASSNR